MNIFSNLIGIHCPGNVHYYEYLNLKRGYNARILQLNYFILILYLHLRNQFNK